VIGVTVVHFAIGIAVLWGSHVFLAAAIAFVAFRVLTSSPAHST
jgi:hypothetical protein